MSDEFCPRQIVFTIPGNPPVQVTATEDNGAIVFKVDVIEGATTADLRALFFDINEAKMEGMTISGGDGLISSSRIAADQVLNLGRGANLNGRTRDGFDVGIEWGTPGGAKDDIFYEVSFTLSNADGDLTLDDIGGQRFGAKLDSIGGPGGPRTGGASQLLGIAPYAPDAVDDVIAMFEDGAAGLDDPSKSPDPVVLNVLANDTDGDGDSLIITSIHEQPDHGTVAIAADGKSLIYTPELDYSGPVTFEYCVSDGAGGQDHAMVTLNIAAVADDPVVSVTVSSTGVVNEVMLHVVADQDDVDSSEFLTAILTNALPAGVTISPVSVTPGGDPDQIVQDFLLTLPIDQDHLFDLTFTVESEEESNGDTETSTVTVPIVYEYNTATQGAQFSAIGQSIWESGDSFTFVDDRFFGVDTGPFNQSIGGGFYAGVEGHILLGLQSTLTFNGGEINATADYDLTVETNYNKTTDVLLIGTNGFITGAEFDTTGPEGSYLLAFLYDVALRAYAGVNIDLGPLGSVGGEATLVDFGFGPGSFPILDLDSADAGGTLSFPPPLDSLSLDWAWPHITTGGSFPPDPVLADGASNNFLQLNLDVDQMVAQLLFGGANPFDPPRIDFGPIFADADILDVDIMAGLNFLQEFALDLGELAGTLLFEDGSSQGFTFGDELLIADASLIDLGGDGDGLVEFTFALAPEAELSNDTLLGFNVGVGISLLSVEIGYDIEVASDSTTLGPLASFGAVVPVAEVSVYQDTFDLAFVQQQFAYAA
jgi:Cadherin-like domain